MILRVSLVYGFFLIWVGDRYGQYRLERREFRIVFVLGAWCMVVESRMMVV